ncbi:hypothetical protein BTN33_21545 [Aeromonas veronii]|uniref:restriction endonuclease subunit S n=1 Tax=Aeromonas veronii TaxID=654 RepID=UPI0009471132|nr:restriction endonuclease subunit S [Aeromonas veronii]OLF56957.1 hypothetical protein BTN33_21545 [Aeromonas veronii]
MELMPGYKRSDIGVIPEEWDIRPLLSTVRIANGQVSPRVEPYKSMVLVAPDHIESSTGKLLAKKTAAEQGAISGKYVFESGDIVYSKIRPYLRKAILADFSGLCSADMYPLKPATDISARYILAVILGYRFSKYAESVSVRSGMPKINRTELADFSLAVPLPPEQRAIAKALSDADELLTTLDQVIAKKRDLKQAAMQQLLTGKTRLPGFFGEWQKKTLGELGVTYGGLTGKTKSDFGVGTAKYVTFMNVMTNTVIDCAACEQVNVSASETQNRVLRGDLLFNGSSETPEEVAFCSLMAEEVPDLYLNSFCFGFRLFDDQQVNGLFLTYYIRANPGREMMKSLAQGSTRYNLSKTALREASVLLPLKDEQVAIADVLSEMDAELIALEARRDKTDNIKQAMMQELLTGKTRLVEPRGANA